MICKQLVWEAYKRVKANKGAPGVDEQSIVVFESDLKGNLYKIWNRMSSGTYFPPPVRAVEIPKPQGTRVLGVPTVGDRIAQTVVALTLEPRTEVIFHPDSYGYRPGKSAHDALAACRERCWQKDWVLDLDIRSFFDSLEHDLVVKAVSANITAEQRWVLLYVKRWLTAPLQLPDGTLQPRHRGTPQGSAVTSTQLAIRVLLSSGSTCRGLCCVVADRDGVSDGDLVGADEDVFDEQAQHALAVGDGCGGGLVAQSGEEVFEVVGKTEVDLAVGELGVTASSW